jgi:uncharacterized protein
MCRALLRLAMQCRGCVLFTSSPILQEIEEKLLEKFGYSLEETRRIIREIKTYVKIHKVSCTVKVSSDLEDNKILECALSSKTKYIISGDDHLKKIKDYKGIKIISPREFKELLEKDNIFI